MIRIRAAAHALQEGLSGRFIMTKVSALFYESQDAHGAISKLKAAGVREDHVSVLGLDGGIARPLMRVVDAASDTSLQRQAATKRDLADLLRSWGLDSGNVAYVSDELTHGAIFVAVDVADGHTRTIVEAILHEFNGRVAA